MNIEKLKEAYKSNPAVKAICDELASRDRNQNKTRLKRMLQLLWEDEGSELTKSQVINGFRKLEEAECGRYVPGRRGWESRFEWTVKSIEVANAAKGKGPLEPSSPGDNPGDVEMIEHTFVLRPDLVISVDLPDDLTNSEAARLAAFVGALSFDEEA